MNESMQDVSTLLTFVPANPVRDGIICVRSKTQAVVLD